MERYVMKKALLFSILSLFLCANLAFASAEPTIDKINMEFHGKVATEKDGILGATIILGISFDPSVSECNEEMRCLFTKVELKITISHEDGKIYYDKSFPCTVFTDSDGSGKVTSTSALMGELSNFYSEDPTILPPTMLVQIPGDGITGNFTWFSSYP
jgi:hypothetical protein